MASGALVDEINKSLCYAMLRGAVRCGGHLTEKKDEWPW